MTQRLIVIGAGMASGRVLEEVLARCPGAYDITLIGAEPRGNYNRIQLSPVLAGEKSYDEIVTHDAAWYAANGIATRFGAFVTGIDRAARVVHLGAEALAYDRLLIATGSNPAVLPVPGATLPGVVSFRDLDDVNAMIAASRPGARAVVIGGGLLGLEAAAGLHGRGVAVTVLHRSPTLMNRQLDAAAGYLLQRDLEARGITVLCRANTESILGDECVRAVRLTDGRDLPCDLVVMAAGIVPNTGLARAAGLAVKHGVLVGDDMITSDAAILAVGECVEHRGQTYGLVAPLFEMAKVVAAQLAGDAAAAYAGSVTATRLKVTGVDLFSAGDFADARDREEIVFRDAARGVYKRLVLKDSRIIGAVMYGETADGNWFFQQLRDQADIAANRETLIFGPNFAGGPQSDPLAAVAALADDAEICGCNGVCKGTITQAIGGGAITLVDLRAKTKASASCGTCTGLVEQLLTIALGDAYAAPVDPGMCPCTDLTHEEVRRLIKLKALKSIPAVMQELEWRTSCGCHHCRPALNYYLLADWPGEYVDDAQSRFINERVHANIQKDGTFSVVPRMWGGLTNARELRAIADAADKYNVPTVKVTGGQRIDLLGVRKEDLPNIWADLNAAGMVSGHAYAKGVRTVKTCVGTDHCRFGTQDSTGLGVKIEQVMWGSWTPAKVKMAVSGCPRNCAESTCKDVGVICVDSGYEISVAGAAGLDLKQTVPLAKVATEAEALEHVVAFVQLYREHARYLHRPYKWVDKVGMDWVRARVTDDADSRKGLAERFYFSQTFYQIDPWAERARGAERHEFSPLADLSTREAAE